MRKNRYLDFAWFAAGMAAAGLANLMFQAPPSIPAVLVVASVAALCFWIGKRRKAESEDV